MEKPKMPIKKVKLANKKVAADLKQVFEALSKAALMLVAANPITAANEGMDAAKAFSLEDEPPDLAFRLVLGALVNASHDMLMESRHKLEPDFAELAKLYDDDRYVQFLDGITKVLTSKEYFLDRDGIRDPRRLDLLADYAGFLQNWFTIFGIGEGEAKLMAARFPSYFVLAMHNEWRGNGNSYAKLWDALDSPMSGVLDEELEWDSYRAYLQKQLDEPVFDESFSLKQIYIPLNAYHLIKDKKRPLKLHNELDEWVETQDRKQAIKVISGGPGSGKSSTLKVWAGQLAERKALKVLFVPLHLLDLESSLTASVWEYLRKGGLLKHNPLERLAESQEKLLLIFDGLDELSKQGKVGETVAKDFVRKIEDNCSQFNHSRLRLMVLLSGRELVVQSVGSVFRGEKRLLHLLPYHLDEEKRKGFEREDDPLLCTDMRDGWWANYGKLGGMGYPNMPSYLKSRQLEEITAQPLLNYLVALSVKRGKLQFDENTNLNEIYRDLIERVHERAWEKREHKGIRGMERDHFIRILEEMAVSAWHGGDVRTTTVAAIQRHIDGSGLNRLFGQFREGAKSGITRLLTAFYFRQSDVGSETFEFTHKSFGEYLTARRLVGFSLTMLENRRANEKDFEEGWNERDALQRWLQLTGETPIDGYLVSFAVDELKLQGKGTIGELQCVLCDLFSYNLRKGFNFKKRERKDMLTEVRMARNAEESLFVLMNCCARITEKISKPNWEDELSFSKFLSRMQPARLGDENCVAYRSCSFLDVSESMLRIKDMMYVIADRSNVIGCNLVLANLIGANFSGADLSRADLYEANLYEANLYEANLFGANLSGANLSGAILSGVYLSGAYLSRANLRRATLFGVKLTKEQRAYAKSQGAILD